MRELGTREERILVVEDEEPIRDLVTTALRFTGFTVEAVATGPEGLALARNEPWHVLVLDVNLPGLDGFSLCRKLREAGDEAPVIFLTARDDPADLREGFTGGGDDYLTKPFSLEGLVLRVEAMLRRRRGRANERARMTVGDIVLDDDAHRVWRADREIDLSPTEYRLLRFLMLNAGRVLSRPRIIEHVWDYGYAIEPSGVETYISYLRRKLEDRDARLIRTVRGVGYSLRERAAMSLSTRIALGVAVVLMLTLIGLGAALTRVTRATLTAEIDDRLVTSVELAANRPGPWDGGLGRRDRVDDGPARERGEDAIVFGPDVSGRSVGLFVIGPGGQVLVNEPSGYGNAPDPLPMLPPIPGSVATAIEGQIITLPAVDDSLRYRVLLRPGPGGTTFVTAASLRPVDEAVNTLISALVVVGLLALAVAALASWWVIRHGLRPVDRMVETAAAIAAGDLSRRVPDADPETELGRLGTALNEMLGQIEAGIQERAAGEARLRRFVADAAHELRTPLTSLRGYAELYRQGALPTTDAVGNAMGRIESEGARMARLVDDLLLLARTDQGRALEKEPVDLVRLAREAAGDFAAADPGRSLTSDLNGSAVVVGDPIRLRQAIDNLLANVRAHTPTGTPARVSVQRNGRWAEVTVADDGPGIPPEDQTRIFERFWRGDPARGRTSAGGAGLGLSIVDALVRAHGGTIAVNSAPGQGTAFTMRLPLDSGDRASG